MRLHIYIRTYLPMLCKCSCARVLNLATEVTGTSGEKSRADNGKTRVNTAALKKRSHLSKAAGSDKWLDKTVSLHMCAILAVLRRPGEARCGESKHDLPYIGVMFSVQVW